MAQLRNTTINDTGFLQLPAGTTGQRPTPASGQMRFNSDTGKLEQYNAGVAAWIGTPIAGVVATGGNSIYDVDVEGTTYRVHVFTSTGNSTFTATKGGEIEYLIVAGGGGGGSDRAGGGGAGGLLTGTTTVTSQNYTITVGAGGQGGQGDQVNGSQGANSSAFGFTAIGGGFGSYQTQTAGTGGSGGGGGGTDNGGSGAGGAGTAGQGNAGGSGNINGGSSTTGASGGGGGAGGVGRGGVAGTKAGDGGPGIISFLSGFSAYYAGGGGGGVDTRGTGDNVGLGGLGGGGSGGSRSPSYGGNIFPLAGTPNTGGGGGGGGLDPINGDPAFYGQAGGSGIVIVRYPLRQENLSIAPGKVGGKSLLLDLDFAKPTVYSGLGTTVTDSRLNGISGSFVNTVTPQNIRTIRSALEMFGNGGYIQMSQTSWGELPAYTVAYWARRDAESRMVIGGSNTRFYWYGDNSWRYTHASGGEFYYPKSVSIPVGTWGYYVATYDGSAVRIYRQGVLEGSQNTTGTANFDLATFRFGYYNGSNTYAFDGLIGSIQIYSRALSTTEVAQYYNATRWRYGV